jgi:hypothetical protein
MTSCFRNHGRWLLIFVAGYLAFALPLNLLVNPLRSIPVAWSLAALDEYRDIDRDVRTGKAGLVFAHRDAELAVIGSSRFEIGVDPAQPALQATKAVNLAMAAGSLYENMAMARYLMARNTHLRRLIFGLDLGDLSSEVDSRKFTDFYSSPLAEEGVSMDGTIRQMAGIGASEESVATIYRFIRDIPSSRTPLGQWITPRHPHDLRVYLSANRDVIFDQVADMCELRPQSIQSAKTQKLKELLVDLRRRGVQVFVTLPPQLALKQLHPSLDLLKVAPWSTERRAIAALCGEVNAVEIHGAPLVQLWDFATFCAPACAALPSLSGEIRQIPHWFDMGHFDAEIGREMVERMLGAQPVPVSSAAAEEFGVNVLQAGIESDLEILRRGHARYCREHPDDVAWVRSVMPVIKAGQLGGRKTGAVDGE